MPSPQNEPSLYQNLTKQFLTKPHCAGCTYLPGPVFCVRWISDMPHCTQWGDLRLALSLATHLPHLRLLASPVMLHIQEVVRVQDKMLPSSCHRVLLLHKISLLYFTQIMLTFFLSFSWHLYKTCKHPLREEGIQSELGLFWYLD